MGTMRRRCRRITATIAVIGGRVTPAFTRNAMRQNGIDTDLPVSHALVVMMTPTISHAE